VIWGCADCWSGDTFNLFLNVYFIITSPTLTDVNVEWCGMVHALLQVNPGVNAGREHAVKHLLQACRVEAGFSKVKV